MPVGDAAGVIVAVTIGVGEGVGCNVTSTVTIGVGEGADGLHAVNNTANNSTTVATKKIFLLIDCFRLLLNLIFSIDWPVMKGISSIYDQHYQKRHFQPEINVYLPLFS